MDWNSVIGELERILGTKVQMSVMPYTEWGSLKRSAAGSGDQHAESGDAVYFLLQREGSMCRILSVPKQSLQASETMLIELALEAYRSADKKGRASNVSDEERHIGTLKEWLERQLELGITASEMPDALTAQFSLSVSRVPMLLQGEYSNNRNVGYRELKKLLESFFGVDMTVVPLKDKEWLILGSSRLVEEAASVDKDTDAEDSMEESLASIAEGLHEMLLSDWVGDFHIAIAHSIIPAKSLSSAVHMLRECIMLGRAYHRGQSIHLPWNLHLEKLLYAVGDTHKSKFLENVLKKIDHVLDAETLTTLEQFFELDCNVSETAKKLYIHRNTLLYRLDKFKQETGMDVRTFNDAVLVKLALLLYKVTKRQ